MLEKRFLMLAAALLMATWAAAASAAVAPPFAITFAEEPPAPPQASASSTTVFNFTANRSPVTYQCFLDGTPSPAPTCTPPVTYDHLSNGSHSFSLVATYTDLSTKRSIQTKAARTWLVEAPPDTKLTSRPPATTNATSAGFVFVADPAGASFECALDGSGFVPCTSPKTYQDLGLGSHSFQVRAVSGELVDSSPASATWTIVHVAPLGLDTLLTNRPLATTTVRAASFDFVSVPAGASFECALDASAFAPCTSPASYVDLGLGTHRFRVRAVRGDRFDPTPAAAGWTIQPAAATTLETRLTERPATSTETKKATFAFVSIPAGAVFECSLDDSRFAPCASPTTYDGLGDGHHGFRVRAVSGPRRDSTPAVASWTITAASAGGGLGPWLAGGAAVLAALAAGAWFGWRHVRLMRRRGEWQLEASDGEPPPTCQVPHRYTWRHGCTATPKLWKVGSLAVDDPAQTDSARRQELDSESTVTALNKALNARRAHADEARLRELLAPVLKQLQSEIDRWLGRWAPAPAADVTATLTGCEFECEFTHFECIPDAGTNHWKKRDHWKAKVEATAVVPVTTGAGRGEAANRIRLEADVLSFVRRVDIPWKMHRPPSRTAEPGDEWAEGLGRLPQN